MEKIQNVKKSKLSVTAVLILLDRTDRKSVMDGWITVDGISVSWMAKNKAVDRYPPCQQSLSPPLLGSYKWLEYVNCFVRLD